MAQHYHPNYHPISQTPITGVPLGAGVLLYENDRYAASGGVWELCPCPGLRIRPGCTTVWVRPNVELSSEAKSLLAYLVQGDYYLTHRGEWIVIPSLSLRHDSRIHWRVLHPECVDELERCGFIQPLELDEEVYSPSEAGRSMEV